MADVRCGLIRDTRPMADCISCENHVKDGTSLEWCRYRKPEPQKTAQQQLETLPINAIEMQIRDKVSKAEYFYKRGWTKAADRLSNEAAQLEFNLRRIKNEQKNA